MPVLPCVPLLLHRPLIVEPVEGNWGVTRSVDPDCPTQRLSEYVQARPWWQFWKREGQHPRVRGAARPYLSRAWATLKHPNWRWWHVRE